MATLKTAMMALQGGRCFYCGCKLHSGMPRRSVPRELALDVRGSQLDHFVPKSAGGPDAIGNVVASCLPCNADKGDRAPTATERERLAAIFDGVATSVRSG